MTIFFVCIFTNPGRSMLCAWVTPDLVGQLRAYAGGRTIAHQFPGRHRNYQLIHYEEYGSRVQADARCRELRRWKRRRKLDLIRRVNPHGRTLNAHFTGPAAA